MWTYFGFYKSAEGKLIEDGLSAESAGTKQPLKVATTSNLLSHLCDHDLQLYGECGVSYWELKAECLMWGLLNVGNCYSLSVQ